MNIGILTGSLSHESGGLFHSVRGVANQLASDGHRVTVYGIWDSHFQTARSQWEVNRIVALRSTGPRKLGFTFRLRSAIEFGDHDILHVQGLWFYPIYAAYAWSRRTGRPFLISPRGTLDPWALKISATRKRFLLGLFVRKCLEGASAIHALCDEERASILALGINNDIVVIPNGVGSYIGGNLPRYNGVTSRRRLLFMGRIHPKKGLAELLDAWAYLREINADLFERWQLVVAGWDDGGHLFHLQRQVSLLGLTDYVLFVGAVFGTVKHELLCGADAFVLPSRSEGLPMSALEALAVGLPCFLTAACNMPDAFVCGAAIRIPQEPIEMGRVLAENLENHAVMEAARLASRQLWQSKYHLAAVTKSFEDVYSRVILSAGCA